MIIVCLYVCKIFLTKLMFAAQVVDLGFLFSGLHVANSDLLLEIMQRSRSSLHQSRVVEPSLFPLPTYLHCVYRVCTSISLTVSTLDAEVGRVHRWSYIHRWSGEDYLNRLITNTSNRARKCAQKVMEKCTKNDSIIALCI